MRVEQAVFASAKTSRMQGYQLIARSAGICAGLARALSQWCPTHASLQSNDWDASSLNFTALHDGWVCVSRSVYGAPEYSERGALQVVTVLLAMRWEQLAGYDYNPASVVRAAWTLGQLRLRSDLTDALPPAEIPEQAEAWTRGLPQLDAAQEAALIQLMRAMESKPRVALFDVRDPLAVVEHLFHRAPHEWRASLSFCTGLKPAAGRPFRVHFVCSADGAALRRLMSLGIEPLTVSQTLA